MENVRKPSLYKPAVYAKLLNRPDVSLFTEFQHDMVLQKNSLEMSNYFASHIGLIVDGINAYLGVPKALWGAFGRINWQSFSVVDDLSVLNLYFDVEVEKQKVLKRSYGQESTSSLEVDRLKMVIPLHPCHSDELIRSSILHICCINDAHERDESIPPVSITKIHSANI
ncbi:hypothetical protein [Vibrio agarivorans]|uniref:hypothetical protein n=1 Tax=Vibrio agarivorans TaxID=153622 RepID=UPI0025B504EE|nr:hypothetical protein [Vibrio agarivorans]MDN3661099.1 hypothetical protein [Vibrio agarivorans]